ncbi:hypothetical protein F4778DRAFT_429940 [Xylariomycetidae sp. FL2044]|nr:hypothetical protein F4778DRAFT_429940 [Xylariomycetidae sp. FL2044]
MHDPRARRARGTSFERLEPVKARRNQSSLVRECSRPPNYSAGAPAPGSAPAQHKYSRGHLHHPDEIFVAPLRRSSMRIPAYGPEGPWTSSRESVRNDVPISNRESHYLPSPTEISRPTVQKTVRFQDDEILEKSVPRHVSFFPDRDWVLFDHPAPQTGKLRGRSSPIVILEDHSKGHRASADRKLRVFDVPRTPRIPRLQTPELENMTSDVPMAKNRGFCGCCEYDGETGTDAAEWRGSRVKMEKQVDEAKAYIERRKMRGRLLDEK